MIRIEHHPHESHRTIALQLERGHPARRLIVAIAVGVSRQTIGRNRDLHRRRTTQRHHFGHTAGLAQSELSQPVGHVIDFLRRVRGVDFPKDADAGERAVRIHQIDGLVERIDVIVPRPRRLVVNYRLHSGGLGREISWAGGAADLNLEEHVKETIRRAWGKGRHLQHARHQVACLLDPAQGRPVRIQRHMHESHRTHALQIQFRHPGRGVIQAVSIRVSCLAAGANGHFHCCWPGKHDRLRCARRQSEGDLRQRIIEVINLDWLRSLLTSDGERTEIAGLDTKTGDVLHLAGGVGRQDADFRAEELRTIGALEEESAVEPRVKARERRWQLAASYQVALFEQRPKNAGGEGGAARQFGSLVQIHSHQTRSDRAEIGSHLAPALRPHARRQRGHAEFGIGRSIEFAERRHLPTYARIMQRDRIE